MNASGNVVTVNGDRPEGLMILPLLSWIALVGGTALAVYVFPAWWILVGLGGLGVVIYHLISWRCRAREVEVTDTGDGFEWSHNNRELFFEDEDVVHVNLTYKRNEAEGMVKSVDRTFEVKVQSEDAPLVMKNRLTAEDPLAPLIDRIVENYKEKADGALEQGAQVSGKDWVLTDADFSTKINGVEETIAIKEIAAVDIFDDHYMMWRDDDEQPFFKAKMDQKNMFLLQLLIAPRLTERDENAQPPGSGLGRVLFERRSTLAGRIGLLVVAILCCLIGAGLLLVGERDTFPIGIILSIVGLFMAPIAFLMWDNHFRCHQHGVFQKSFTKEKSLRYLDVESFTYTATRHYTNGAYTGTAYAMTFTPFVEADGQKIRLSGHIRQIDDSLDILRDHVSQVIAGRMGKTLHEQERVAWTKNLTYTSEGIEYRASKFTGRAEAKLLTYKEYGGQNLQDGVFYLFEKGVKKPVMQEPISTPNFFPGYFLLMSMTTASEEAET